MYTVTLYTVVSSEISYSRARPENVRSGRSAVVPLVGTAVVTPTGVSLDQEVGGMVHDRLAAPVQRRRDPGPRQRADLVVRERGEAAEVHGHLPHRTGFRFSAGERGKGGHAEGGSGEHVSATLYRHITNA